MFLEQLSPDEEYGKENTMLKEVEVEEARCELKE